MPIKKYNSAVFTDAEIAAANQNTYLIEAMLDAIHQCKQWPLEDIRYGAVQERVQLWQAAVHKALNE